MKGVLSKLRLPRGLYGRAALILILPIVILQLVVSVVFIQRHFEGVTRQMTRNVAIEVQFFLDKVGQSPDLQTGLAETAEFAEALELTAGPTAQRPITDQRGVFDFSGITLVAELHNVLPALLVVDLKSDSRRVRMYVGTGKGDLLVEVQRRRFSASNPHQLLVLMIFTGLVMTLIAFFFLRNQLRPIRRLSRAAEAFGKGQHVSYRPSGAVEVRLAGSAFLDMRARIERQIEQRTLMLSGVSHDLRTPLTRLKLALSLMPEGPDQKDMAADIEDMERMLDAFLDFARSDAVEKSELITPDALVARICERNGDVLELGPIASSGPVGMRPLAVTRSVQNLVNNALNYGSRARLSVVATSKSLKFVVEDDGPGIPPAARERAMQPFMRLDEARNQNAGGGVGLGLAIAADIARQHGGALRLKDSNDLGGLCAEFVIAR
ncbi:histidine kinase [Actibacterium mucosum KCTC 23349]|uniref:histidine kinase n=1 Tax=Actibacterium mucosum KCTC 23349 TaxID=1454373 RepID=A0A037ZJX9_9RHOB|nr:ATP-binding protein [Actibacterium mucosum]KAJ55857.1 histidine kinase [Actibacterium mucosum KCTC 23349]